LYKTQDKLVVKCQTTTICGGKQWASQLIKIFPQTFLLLLS